jgi:hypothetical protein
MKRNRNSYIGGNVDSTVTMGNYMEVPKEMKIVLSYDPAVPPRGTCCNQRK